MIGVYFLESYGLIKIGSTVDAHKRLYSIQGQCPTKLTLIGFVEMKTRVEASILESNLHYKFHEYRHHREWFNSSEYILAYIKANSTIDICKTFNQVLDTIYNIPPKRSGLDLNKRSVIMEIYQFVSDHPDATVRSISIALNIYDSVVKTHLNRLRQEGLVNRIKNK